MNRHLKVFIVFVLISILTTLITFYYFLPKSRADYIGNSETVEDETEIDGNNTFSDVYTYEVSTDITDGKYLIVEKIGSPLSGTIAEKNFEVKNGGEEQTYFGYVFQEQKAEFYGATSPFHIYYIDIDNAVEPLRFSEISTITVMDGKKSLGSFKQDMFLDIEYDPINNLINYYNKNDNTLVSSEPLFEVI